ncbi:MAG: DUF2807 domain-containing protein [Bacteroides sp.]|nr:DUF2807 domain-containing protein [Bacteroides sp.]
MNMKKHNIIGLILIGLMALMPQLSIQAQEVSKEFKVEKFHSLDLTTVGAVYFTQASKCSVKIDGKKENVDKLNVYVEDGTLNIEPKEENLNGTKNGVNIYITAPTLENLVFCGVGALYCNETLKLDNFKCTLQGVGKMYIRDLKCDKLTAEVEGVGKADIHVECQEVNAEIDGIGSLTLSGETAKANIEKDGIGVVSTGNLKIIK